MNRAGNERLGNSLLCIPVSAGKEIEAATMIAINEEGYAVPAVKQEGLRIAGVAQEYVDNRTGDAGKVSVYVKRGAFVFNNDGTIQKTDILKNCYISGSQEVTLSKEGTSLAGTILGVEDDGIIVEIK